MRYRLFCVLALLLFCVPFWGEEETVASRVYVSGIASDDVKLADMAAVLEETIRSALSTSTNVQLYLPYQATNFTDLSDPVKFLTFNRFHGMIGGKLSRENGAYRLDLRFIERSGSNTTETCSFSTLPEGLQILISNLPGKVETAFPRLPKRVVVVQDVEKPTGRFSVNYPTLYTSIGWTHEAGMNFSPIQITERPYWETLSVGMNLRYDWWGIYANCRHSVMGEDCFGFYAAPELLLLQGMLALRLSVGYEKIKIGFDTGSLLIERLITDLMIEANVTENYQLRLGAHFTPLSSLCPFSILDTAGNPMVYSNSKGDFSTGTSSALGGSLGFTVRFAPDLAADFLYTIDALSSDEMNGAFMVKSAFALSCSYRFVFGGEQ